MSARNVLESQQSAVPTEVGRTAPGYWQLAAGRALSLRPRDRSVLEIAQGRVWLTHNGVSATDPPGAVADHVLCAGDGLTIAAGAHVAIEPWTLPGAPEALAVAFRWGIAPDATPVGSSVPVPSVQRASVGWASGGRARAEHPRGLGGGRGAAPARSGARTGAGRPCGGHGGGPGAGCGRAAGHWFWPVCVVAHGTTGAREGSLNAGPCTNSINGGLAFHWTAFCRRRIIETTKGKPEYHHDNLLHTLFPLRPALCCWRGCSKPAFGARRPGHEPAPPHPDAVACGRRPGVGDAQRRPPPRGAQCRECRR